jgi:hypothetical protein
LLRFSPNCRTLAAFRSASAGQLIRLWFAPSFAEIAVAEGRDYRAEMGQVPATWMATGNALLKRHREAEALEVFSGLIRLCGDHPDLQTFRTSALKQRAELLARDGRFAEAGADNCAALGIPARDPSLPPAFIDLSAYFNQSLDQDPEDSIPVQAAFPTLPRGRRALPGSSRAEFDIRGVVLLKRKADWPIFQNAAEGIPIQQKCRRLHFLQSANFREPEDTLVATYIVHYTDGKFEEIPIRYGHHVRDWGVSVDPNDPYDAKVAWTQPHPTKGAVRIFLQTWENPRPDTGIKCLDFVSKLTQCAPFLLAITAE